jgi:hypothetical protein
LLLDLRPLSLIAASCLAAGESTLPAPDALEDPSSATSLAMVAGLERGEGFVVRLIASEDDPRGGMLTLA